MEEVTHDNATYHTQFILWLVDTFGIETRGEMTDPWHARSVPGRSYLIDLHNTQAAVDAVNRDGNAIGLIQQAYGVLLTTPLVAGASVTTFEPIEGTTVRLLHLPHAFELNGNNLVVARPIGTEEAGTVEFTAVWTDDEGNSSIAPVTITLE